tara:strand:- start:3983 stop:4921 length:939 start_codon:yes stop_codon:yes gene_type:complete
MFFRKKPPLTKQELAIRKLQASGTAAGLVGGAVLFSKGSGYVSSKTQSQINRALVKEASVSARARALEVLAGLVVGGGAGGMLAGKTFQTKKPRHWISGNQLYGRDLTKSEKKDYVKRIGKGLALGGTAATGLSLGFSAFRRGRLRTQDLVDGSAAFKDVFKHLDKAVRQQQSRVRVSKRSLQSAKSEFDKIRGLGNSEAKLSPDQAVVDAATAHKSSKAALQRLEQMRNRHGLKTYQDWAQRARDHVPWGGSASAQAAKGGQVFEIPSRMTTMGQIMDAVGHEAFQFKRLPTGQTQVVSPNKKFWLAKAGA